MNNIMVCQRCKTELGKVVVIDGIEFLLLDGVLCRQAHGICDNCGLEFHWSVPDRELAELAEKVKQMNC